MKNKAMEYTKSTLAIEGLYLTKEEEELILSKVNGELSKKEFIEKAKELSNG
ncbi:antitoxin VbhA family protein [Pontibacillus litoralis]|uniref:Antitoxin VbhA domain-containing protein n=1 Tax=Pontibacillus litoralis JSM 072002 TaxID=1385512 RepID=A0A0A5G236_9BACI|nr:antitoxin VbhA family protein [Pontibacillus litoralis]KGX85203.1 hypothetical protein N784_09915 [Pontibacillus litoralis JSM 072002]